MMIFLLLVVGVMGSTTPNSLSLGPTGKAWATFEEAAGAGSTSGRFSTSAVLGFVLASCLELRAANF